MSGDADRIDQVGVAMTTAATHKKSLFLGHVLPLPLKDSQPRSPVSVHPQTQISGVEGAAIRKKELPHTLTGD